MIEIELQKMKKGTGTKTVLVHKPGQTPYRQEFASGRKPSREGTGKIDKLPDNIKNNIIELRNLNYSGSQIKNNIETMLDTADPEVRQKLIDANVITDVGSKLTVTSVAITQFAAKHGAKPTKTHGPKSAETIQAQEKAKHDATKKQLSEADNKAARLETELRNLKDRIEASKKDSDNKQKVREKLRSDLRACHEKLKS